MNKSKKTYYPRLNKQLIALVFYLFLAINPVVNVISFFSEDSYEMAEVFNDEKSESDTSSEETTDENLPIFENNNVLFLPSITKNKPLFIYQVIYLNLELDIFLRPPELV